MPPLEYVADPTPRRSLNRESMQSRDLILSTCGTSLLTNAAREPERRQQLVRLSNLKHREEVPDCDRPWAEELLARVQEELLAGDLVVVSKMSAELNALIRFYGGKASADRSHHILLCTDTWLGEATARIIEAWFKKQGASVNVIRQRDLQTADLEAFQLALSELVRWSEETLPGYRERGYRIIFNLTGGFKSVQGFLQTIAMFYADEVIYLFQEANDLMRIPRLPIKLTANDTVRQHLQVFRRLGASLGVAHTDGVPETLLMTVAGQTALSPWGNLVWEQSRKEIYRGRLWPSPSLKIRFGETFQESLRDLDSDWMALINQKIDHLAQYLETNLDRRSLDLKQLKGDPELPSTHELDAGPDQGAKRIFGHYEGDQFVLDKLGNRL